MKPRDNEVVWEFDGSDGHANVMGALVLRYIEALDDLLPEDYDDPMDQLAAEFADRPDELVDADPGLARLFPPALDDPEQARQFRRDAITQQARERLEAARMVLADVSLEDDSVVYVTLGRIDAWVKTMSAMRAQWNVELTGSADRLAEATRKDIATNPTAVAVCDWLGYLIEDALEARAIALEDM